MRNVYAAIAGALLLLFAGVASAANEVLPKAEPAFQGKIGATARRFRSQLAATRHRSSRGAKHCADIAGQRRIRRIVNVWGSHANPGAGPPGGRRPALQPLPRERTVLADSRRASFRPQLSPGWLRPHRRIGRWLPGLQLDLAEDRGLDRRSAENEWLQHRGLWQMAQHAVWEVNPAGPYDRWPIGKGFEYFYGFLAPLLASGSLRCSANTLAVEPKTTPREGYHLTTDLVDDAINWVHQHDAVAQTRPFFIYFATGSRTFPTPGAGGVDRKVQGQMRRRLGRDPPAELRASEAAGRHSGQRRVDAPSKQIPAWDEQTPEQKKLLAHQAEVYATLWPTPTTKSAVCWKL